MLISPDGVNYYTYDFDNNIWVNVLIDPDVNNTDHVNTVLTQGINYLSLPSINATSYNQLLSEGNDTLHIAIAIEYNKTNFIPSIIQSINLLVDSGSTYEFAKDTYYTLAQTLSSLEITFNQDGTYIVYYED